MKKYYCTVCQWVYDPAIGDPESGIAPGTAFEDIPEDWCCPLCGVGKEDFAPVEDEEQSLAAGFWLGRYNDGVSCLWHAIVFILTPVQ